MFALMCMRSGDVRLLDVVFFVCADVLFVAQGECSACFHPARVFVFARRACGDFSLPIDFDGFFAHAACTLDEGTSIVAARASLIFKPLSASCALMRFKRPARASLVQGRCDSDIGGTVVGDAHFVKAAKEQKVRAGNKAALKFGIGELAPLPESYGFEHG